MALVDPDFAEWLGRAQNRAIASSAAVGESWGALAIDAEISSALAFKDDAVDEAARQLGFLSAPAVIDKLRIHGQRADLIGKVISAQTHDGDYAGGQDVFVLAADETETAGMTVLTVLRRM